MQPASLAPRVRWGIPDAVVAWVVGLVAAIICTTPFVEPGKPDRAQITALLVALGAQNVAIIAWLAGVARRKGVGSLAADFGFALRARDGAWLAAGVGLSIGAGWLLLPITDLAGLHDSAQQVVHQFERAGGLEVPLFALGAVVLAPIAEELLFRGALLRGLMRRTSPGIAVFASALVFALVHVLGDPGTGYYVPAFLLLGLVSGWRAVVTGKLSQSILLHVGFNLLAAVLIVS